MSTEYNVLAPGPVNLHPRVRESLALPMIHHRTPEFDKILKRVLSRLKNLVQTAQPVFILTATGSGGMECLLTNVLKPGDKVLCIDSGKFGERWAEMAKVFGAEVITHKVAWGKAADAKDIQLLLNANPEIRLVLCQACETSTAVLHPIQEIGSVVKNYPNTLFLVDAITALGAFHLPMDEWYIDGLVGGSQKAFMLPTGLSLISFSEKAWKVIESNPQPRYYFDIRRELKANKNGETFFSSNVTLIRALDVVLDLIDESGLKNFFKEISERAQFTRHFGNVLGLKLYAESPSNSVTALAFPPHLDGQKIRAALEEDFRITIMGGQDQAKGKIIRIGHMGYITWPQMKELILALAQVLMKMDPSLMDSTKLKEIDSQISSYLSQKGLA